MIGPNKHNFFRDKLDTCWGQTNIIFSDKLDTCWGCTNVTFYGQVGQTATQVWTNGTTSVSKRYVRQELAGQAWGQTNVMVYVEIEQTLHCWTQVDQTKVGWTKWRY